MAKRNLATALAWFRRELAAGHLRKRNGLSSDAGDSADGDAPPSDKTVGTNNIPDRPTGNNSTDHPAENIPEQPTENSAENTREVSP